MARRTRRGRRRHRKTKRRSHRHRRSKHRRRSRRRRGGKTGRRDHIVDSMGGGRQRGGGLPTVQSSVIMPRAFGGTWGGREAAFPPGPIYKPGVNNGTKFYGQLVKPSCGVGRAPATSNYAIYKPKFGGSRKKRCHHHGKKRCCKKHRRRRGGSRRRRGGGISRFLSNNMPGFNDLRDVYWKGGETAKNVYNQYFGRPATANTSPSVQPIGKTENVKKPAMIPISSSYLDGSIQSAKYNVA